MLGTAGTRNPTSAIARGCCGSRRGATCREQLACGFRVTLFRPRALELCVSCAAGICLTSKSASLGYLTTRSRSRRLITRLSQHAFRERERPGSNALSPELSARLGGTDIIACLVLSPLPPEGGVSSSLLQSFVPNVEGWHTFFYSLKAEQACSRPWAPIQAQRKSLCSVLLSILAKAGPWPCKVT